MKKSIYEIMNHEYLMTNGLGGYSFGTIDQVNSRKYHGLYTVSYNPPIERMHLISKLVETIEYLGETFDMTHENQFGIEESETFLSDFEHKGVVEQVFIHRGIELKRTLAMEYGTNLLVVSYAIDTPGPLNLKLTPLFNFRDHHDTETPNLADYNADFDPTQRILTVSKADKTVFILADGKFEAENCLSPESYYPIETQRGYPDKEKHVVVGGFKYNLESGKHIVEIKINIEPVFYSAEQVIHSRLARYSHLITRAGFKAPQIKRLVQAADDFIVFRKNTGKKTIIAGYPWFTDWGRDTMIAIPGLTLSTNRFEEALEMIEGFILKAYKGIIPNNFPDEGEAPMYNTSDGTLWLFNAIYAYYEATKDKQAVVRLYPELVKMIEHHINGTINSIYMDTDGLLSTGNEDTQLTWMDVKVNGWVVTPRHGKAVEINALWYNAISVMQYLSKEINQESAIEHLELKQLAERVKISFNEQFWNANDQNLYDLIIDGQPIDIPRPNMIFSISLAFAVLDESHWKAIVDYVTKHFKVPYGLLTLRKEDPDFHKTYEGDLLSRDGAYHRGTAWGWLIGPYLEAHYKTYHEKKYIHENLDELFVHLDEGVHGSISEIFEGGVPYAQRGCSAQAWSVAEALRIWKLIMSPN